MEVLPAFARKASSRTSTGRTNREALEPAEPQHVHTKRMHSTPATGDGGANLDGELAATKDRRRSADSGGSSAISAHYNSRPIQTKREGTGQMRDRVAMDLKDDFDRCLYFI